MLFVLAQAQLLSDFQPAYRTMELLNTYEDKDEAEAAEKRITGKKRLASDRDDNEIIYRLFGEPTWGNFYQLEMYELRELKELVDLKKAGQPYD